MKITFAALLAALATNGDAVKLSESQTVDLA